MVSASGVSKTRSQCAANSSFLQLHFLETRVGLTLDGMGAMASLDERHTLVPPRHRNGMVGAQLREHPLSIFALGRYTEHSSLVSNGPHVCRMG